MIKKEELSFYRLTLGCNAAQKINQNKTKPIKPTVILICNSMYI